MTNQTELFSPEIEAEAQRLLVEARDVYGTIEAAQLVISRLLAAMGWKSHVDPIEAAAREIVADQLVSEDCPMTASAIRKGDAHTLQDWRVNLTIARAGIIAGMNMRKP